MTLPTTIRTLALDLEGTLISNAISQVPRPGLREFLEFCRESFGQLLIFSGVREEVFRNVAQRLFDDGEAPKWLVDLQHQHWIGEYKDLRQIDNAVLEETAIIDDQEDCIHPDQKHRWIPICEFETPYADNDRELDRMMRVLAKLRGCG